MKSLKVNHYKIYDFIIIINSILFSKQSFRILNIPMIMINILLVIIKNPIVPFHPVLAFCRIMTPGKILLVGYDIKHGVCL